MSHSPPSNIATLPNPHPHTPPPPPPLHTTTTTTAAAAKNTETWRTYPLGIGGGHNSLTTPAQSLSDRLSRLSEILFSSDDDDDDPIDLRIVDIRSTSDNGTYYGIMMNDEWVPYPRC